VIFYTLESAIVFYEKQWLCSVNIRKQSNLCAVTNYPDTPVAPAVTNYPDTPIAPAVTNYPDTPIAPAVTNYPDTP
jgi:hypothetical protein